MEILFKRELGNYLAKVKHGLEMGKYSVSFLQADDWLLEENLMRKTETTSRTKYSKTKQENRRVSLCETPFFISLLSPWSKKP